MPGLDFRVPTTKTSKSDLSPLRVPPHCAYQSPRREARSVRKETPRHEWGIPPQTRQIARQEGRRRADDIAAKSQGGYSAFSLGAHQGWETGARTITTRRWWVRLPPSRRLFPQSRNASPPRANDSGARREARNSIEMIRNASGP
jgi:hypothetical protein